MIQGHLVCNINTGGRQTDFLGSFLLVVESTFVNRVVIVGQGLSVASTVTKER